MRGTVPITNTHWYGPKDHKYKVKIYKAASCKSWRCLYMSENSWMGCKTRSRQTKSILKPVEKYKSNIYHLTEEKLLKYLK